MATGDIDAIYGGYLSGLVFDRALAASVFVLAITLAIVALFIFKFYKSISKKTIIRLNLKKYNTSEHPVGSKVLAMVLYLLEYIIFMPFLIALWFVALAIVLLLIAEEQTIGYILWISVSMIGAIRILAYVKKEVSEDLAKLFPFITLSVFLLTPGEFSLDILSEKISMIPLLLSNIFSFILVVLLIEIILRVFYTVYTFWASEEEAEITK
jgi:small-conductance mechanosensitive channel